MFYGCQSLVSMPDLSKWNKIKYGRHFSSECISNIELTHPNVYKS